MKVLVWQWGRRGAGPRFAAQLSAAFDQVPGVSAVLSLSTGAELLAAPGAPLCGLPVRTYANIAGLAGRMLASPVLVAGLARRFRAMGLDGAVCAMPGPLDLLCVAALHRAGVAATVIVHDAEAHPGDGFPLLMMLQRQLVRRADAVVTLSSHVAEQLRGRQLIGARAKLIVADHPPFDFGPVPPAFGHGDGVRLLSFGRLLPYKGLDLLVEALKLLGPRPGLRVRVVGQGPESEALRALRAQPGVTVENRWVAESEIALLLGWADAVVLPYREASQSGVAAAALAAGRMVICTRVGGLEGQLRDEPLARLCDPDAGSLAAAIGEFVETPVRVAAAAVDPARAWRGLAERLVGEAMAGARHDGFRQPGS
ncbi:MAG TPA: glycosyltransferase [Acetobacteraceae bacterium]